MHLYLADTNVKWFDNAHRGLMHLYLANGDIRNFDSGATGLQNANATCKFLISYYYFKTRNVGELAARWQPLQLFADSGAFSAWSLGGQIDVHEYADWLHKYKHLFAIYANLDVKGDIDASLRNQQILEEKGLSPLPVFHRYEPWSVLEDMVQEYPYIALGGLAGDTDPSSAMRWLINAFRIAEGKAVYHGFGMTNFYQMKVLPWHSVDSSSWNSGVRYGQVKVWDTNRHKFLNFKQKDYRAFQQHAGVLKRLGFDWRDFYQQRAVPRDAIMQMSAVSYRLVEEYVTSLHGPVEIPA